MNWLEVSLTARRLFLTEMIHREDAKSAKKNWRGLGVRNPQGRARV